MSLEQRVSILERKFNGLEHAFHENNKVLEATHGVVSMILNEQREKFKEINARFDKQEAFNRQVNENFQAVNENFRQLELLIRQLHSSH